MSRAVLKIPKHYKFISRNKKTTLVIIFIPIRDVGRAKNKLRRETEGILLNNERFSIQEIYDQLEETMKRTNNEFKRKAKEIKMDDKLRQETKDLILKRIH